ncbi:hypothetical protein K439DRAFT_899454 [Ramaria rubella]|nr:hypothetical protein K439DRAFT_899454 [Ramaria rubella]
MLSISELRCEIANGPHRASHSSRVAQVFVGHTRMIIRWTVVLALYPFLILAIAQPSSFDHCLSSSLYTFFSPPSSLSYCAPRGEQTVPVERFTSKF